MARARTCNTSSSSGRSSSGGLVDRVQIIDDDLGKSAAAAEHRQGFQFLIAEVGRGRGGRVIRLDASRLARNNSYWYQLI